MASYNGKPVAYAKQVTPAYGKKRHTFYVPECPCCGSFHEFHVTAQRDRQFYPEAMGFGRPCPVNKDWMIVVADPSKSRAARKKQ